MGQESQAHSGVGRPPQQAATICRQPPSEPGRVGVDRRHQELALSPVAL